MNKNDQKQNLRYNFLYNYIRNILDKVDSKKYFAPIAKLYDENRITLEESDELSNSIVNFNAFVTDLLSKCPFLKIEISNDNDGEGVEYGEI